MQDFICASCYWRGIAFRPSLRLPAFCITISQIRALRDQQYPSTHVFADKLKGTGYSIQLQHSRILNGRPQALYNEENDHIVPMALHISALCCESSQRKRSL
eukprot:s1508_g30.t1